MKSRLEKVYSKLPNQKVNLKAQKVELSLIDDIEEVLNRGLGLEEIARKAIYIAKEKAMFASDVIRFDMNDAYMEAEQLITDATEKLNELGIDDSSLAPYIDLLNQLEYLQKTLMAEVDRIGN
jgi:hypothetical protein